MESIGSKTILWGQRPFYGVRHRSIGSDVTQWGQRSPTGSEVTHEVKGRPMGGSKVNPMGSMASKITLWDL